jgi:uncharacterized protein YndB with AHSA1/START domain
MSQNASTGITFDRSYEADVADLWWLWTTKEGFESWWGPEGFRVAVLALEARVGGELNYDMIAVGAEQIAFMKQSGMAASHGTRGTFLEVVANRRLVLEHVIDFVPGVPAYLHRMSVEFSQAGDKARMVIHMDPHFATQMTRMAAAGMESQLTKAPGALAGRRRPGS